MPGCGCWRCAVRQWWGCCGGVGCCKPALTFCWSRLQGIGGAMTKLTPRQELFARALQRGCTATEAYVEAGYSPKSAAACASRLQKTAKVQQRLRELAQEREIRMEINEPELSARFVLDTLRGIAAKEDAKDADRVSACRELAKCLGLHAPKQHVVEASVEARGPDLELLRDPAYRSLSMELAKRAEELRG